MQRFIDNYWDNQKIVTKQSNFFGPVFTAIRCFNQGGILPPTMFNIQIDNGVRHWLSLVIDDAGVIHNGFGDTVAQKLSLFYADDGLLAALEANWLQHALNVLADIFRRMGLTANTAKTQTMTCFPGRISTGLSAEAYNLQVTGEGETYHQ